MSVENSKPQRDFSVEFPRDLDGDIYDTSTDAPEVAEAKRIVSYTADSLTNPQFLVWEIAKALHARAPQEAAAEMVDLPFEAKRVLYENLSELYESAAPTGAAAAEGEADVCGELVRIFAATKDVPKYSEIAAVVRRALSQAASKAREEAIRECGSAVCPRCRSGLPFDAGFHVLTDTGDGQPRHYPCAASRIRALSPQTQNKE